MLDKKLTEPVDNPNRLTDNEIIKALECCAKSSWLDDCDGCPCFDPKEDIQTSECQERLMKYASDLINRLQSQNKDLAETVHNLTLEKDALFDKAEELKAEVEKLNKEIQITKDAYTMLQTKIEIINSKAVKEFAERLKEKSFQSFGNYGITRDVVEVCDIDNLIKEMVGDKE